MTKVIPLKKVSVASMMRLSKREKHMLSTMEACKHLWEQLTGQLEGYEGDPDFQDWVEWDQPRRFNTMYTAISNYYPRLFRMWEVCTVDQQMYMKRHLFVDGE